MMKTEKVSEKFDFYSELSLLVALEDSIPCIYEVLQIQIHSLTSDCAAVQWVFTSGALVQSQCNL
jgi:hypothetical protein